MRNFTRFVLPVLFSGVLALTVVACGNDGDDDPTDAGTTDAGGVTGPTTALALCQAYSDEFCARATGDCATDFEAVGLTYTDLADCLADNACAASDFAGLSYDATAGAACITGITAMTCQTYIDGPYPVACEVATYEPAPARTGCVTLTAGTVNGTIDIADPQSTAVSGGYYDIFCVELTAGQSVTFTTAPGASNPIDDTVLSLYDGNDAFVTVNDDYGTDFFSQINTTVSAAGTYLLVLSGYDDTSLGDYELTFTVN